jgi:hypothetical protein
MSFLFPTFDETGELYCLSKDMSFSLVANLNSEELFSLKDSSGDVFTTAPCTLEYVVTVKGPLATYLGDVFFFSSKLSFSFYEGTVLSFSLSY